MNLWTVLLTIQAVAISYQNPLCDYTTTDSILPGNLNLGIPSKYKIDISLKKPRHAGPCDLETGSVLHYFNRSSIPYLTLFITCYDLEVDILPIHDHLQADIKTLDLSLIRCNTSVQTLSTLVTKGKLILLSVTRSNIAVPDDVNETDICSAFGNLFELYFDRILPEDLWTLLISCPNIRTHVHTLSIKSISFNRLKDLYMLERLQSLFLNDINLSVFPGSYLEYNELEYNKKYPGFHTYITPFDRKIENFKVVLRLLDFSYNNISHIPVHFTYIYTPMHVFRMSHNRISSLDDGLFTTIRHMLTIDLSFNLIRAIPEKLLWNQVILQHINFQSNLISYIPSKFFKGLVSLITINFAENQITNLDAGLFSINSQYLNPLSVNFGNNQLMDFPGALVANTKFANVNFRNNSLTSIPSEVLAIADLQVGDFSYNLINGTALDRLALSSLDFNRPKSYRKPIVDFSKCPISGITGGKESSTYDMANYQTFFSSYKVLLKDSPINCTCRMSVFMKFLLIPFRFSRTNENAIVVQSDLFDSWKCRYPVEYRGFPVLKLPTSQFSCRIMYSSCPNECECFWYENNRLLVDCTNTNLTDIPSDIELPSLDSLSKLRIRTGHVDATTTGLNGTTVHLKLSKAQLSVFSYKNYLRFVTKVDVSFNKLSTINKKVIEAFKFQTNLSLDISNNQISVLPREITTLHFKEAKLGDNPYTCDCNTLWMKYWIRDRRIPIIDWEDITCLDINKRGRKYVTVPDEDFVCAPKFDTFRRVILPAIGIGSGIICVVIGLILTYAYKQELKVLLFIYIGVHPFDKDNGNYKNNEIVDVFIVHPKNKTTWVLETLVKYLESKNLLVTTICRDSLLGYTKYENIRKLIETSKRIIFCTVSSEDMMSDWFTTSWSLAKEKIKNTKTNYAVLLHLGKSKLMIKDKELKRYVSRGRLVKLGDPIPLQRILYFMPFSKQNRRESRQCRIAQDADQNPCESKIKWSVFVSYDSATYAYVRFKLMPFLQQRGFILHIPDRDFEVGVPNEENYIRAVDGSRYTLFILTKNGYFDEWRRFVFNIAREKSVTEKSNHLLVVLNDCIDTVPLPDELNTYVKTHICTDTGDPLYEQVLLNTLMGGLNNNVAN